MTGGGETVGTHADGPAAVARNSLLVGVATLASRLLGFVRDMLIAGALGAGPLADAFLVAFRLPNLFRRMLGEGGLNAPFVPHYLALKAGQPEAAHRFAGETLASFALGLALLVALAEVLAPWLVLALASGLGDTPQTHALATLYARLALPFLAFATLASVIAAILNAERRFRAAALAPLAFNLLLIGVLAASLAFGVAAEATARTLAIAVSVGGLLHLLLLVVAIGRGAPGWPPLRLAGSGEVGRLMTLAVPSLIAASTAQIVLVVATQIASAEPGAVSWLYYADRIFQLPFGLVAVAMGVVLLPEIARREASGDVEGRSRTLNEALGLDLAIALPAAVALAMLSGPIVSVLFERGQFSAADSVGTAAALAAFAPGLPFGVAATVLSQPFFARREPGAPFLAGLAAILAAVAAGLFLPRPNLAETAARAATLAFVAQALALVAFTLRQRLWRPDGQLLRRGLGVLAACAAMAAALVFLQGLLAPALAGTSALTTRVLALAALCLGGLAVYAGATFAFGVLARADIARLRT